jgi:hypothetical protein
MLWIKDEIGGHIFGAPEFRMAAENAAPTNAGQQ